MKFVIAAVVLLAVAMGVQSSVVAGVPALGLGLGLNGVGINGLGLGINGLGAHGLGLGVNSLGLVNGLGVNGLGLGVNGLGLGVNGIGLGAHGLGLGLAVPQVWNQGAWLGAPAAVNVGSHSLGGVSVAHQAALAGPLVGHAASYVAKTRGAVHTAPLAGHINSVASVNVAPAPGTW